MSIRFIHSAVVCFAMGILIGGEGALVFLAACCTTCIRLDACFHLFEPKKGSLP